jgi:hypothetical protein
MDENFPEPFAQAATGGAQKSAEIFLVAALLLQVTAQVRANRAAEAADDLARQDAAMAEARTIWAEARDPVWLADAGLLDVARAWGAAAPYEDVDAGAAAAMDACEARLRRIHRPAMEHYDSLRKAGMSRAEAMRLTVPEFLKNPAARPAPRDARRDLHLPLPPGAGGQTWVRPGPEETVTAHLLDTIRELDDAAIAAGEGPVSAQVIEVTLMNRTNADPELIRQVADGRREGARLVPPAAPAARPRTVASTGPGAVDWPSTPRAAVEATVLRRAAGGKPRRAARRDHPAASSGRAPGLHP